MTGIHFHPGTGGIDFSDLFLSSSVDWTVRLWRARGDKQAKGEVGGKGKEPMVAIKSFEGNEDYVFDVRWHPVHPSLFGCADGMGKLDLWDLNQDVEVSGDFTSSHPFSTNHNTSPK